jgi:ABC-type glutathione transport system ATPase component
MNDVLLEVDGLTVEYLSQEGSVKACADVSFTLHRGQILGVAGESGSGKSTLITALTRLQRPPAVTSAGRLVYHSATLPMTKALAIVPAYNEAGAITGTIDDLRRHAPEFDVLIVDDGSTDDTAALARRAGARV